MDGFASWFVEPHSSFLPDHCWSVARKMKQGVRRRALSDMSNAALSASTIFVSFGQNSKKCLLIFKHILWQTKSFKQNSPNMEHSY